MLHTIVVNSLPEIFFRFWLSSPVPSQKFSRYFLFVLPSTFSADKLSEAFCTVQQMEYRWVTPLNVGEDEIAGSSWVSSPKHKGQLPAWLTMVKIPMWALRLPNTHGPVSINPKMWEYQLLCQLMVHLNWLWENVQQQNYLVRPSPNKSSPQLLYRVWIQLIITLKSTYHFSFGYKKLQYKQVVKCMSWMVRSFLPTFLCLIIFKSFKFFFILRNCWL